MNMKIYLLFEIIKRWKKEFFLNHAKTYFLFIIQLDLKGKFRWFLKIYIWFTLFFKIVPYFCWSTSGSIKYLQVGFRVKIQLHNLKLYTQARKLNNSINRAVHDIVSQFYKSSSNLCITIKYSGYKQKLRELLRVPID